MFAQREQNQRVTKLDRICLLLYHHFQLPKMMLEGDLYEFCITFNLIVKVRIAHQKCYWIWENEIWRWREALFK